MFSDSRLDNNLGDIFIRDSNLFHRGMKNLSSHPRSMVAITLSRKDIASSIDLSAPFGGEKVEFLNNWFTNNVGGRVLEHTYMYFPVLRSISRIFAPIIREKNLST